MTSSVLLERTAYRSGAAMGRASSLSVESVTTSPTFAVPRVSRVISWVEGGIVDSEQTNKTPTMLDATSTLREGLCAPRQPLQAWR